MSHSVSVAAVVLGDHGRVLTVKRRDNGRWQLPGGVLEPHEPVEHGLVREVLEETGVSVEPHGLSGIYKHIGLGIMSLVFRCRAVGVFVRRLPESGRVSWMSLDEVDREMDDVFRLRVHDAITRDRVGAYLPIRHHDGREYFNSDPSLPSIPRPEIPVWGPDRVQGQSETSGGAMQHGDCAFDLIAMNGHSADRRTHPGGDEVVLTYIRERRESARH